MKKLQVVFLALMSMAFAYTGADFNREVKTKLNEAGYHISCPYTISFRVPWVEKNRAFLRLDDDYCLVNKEYLHWGINNRDTNEIEPSRNWRFKQIDHRHILTSNPGERIVSWALAADGHSAGERRAGKHLAVQIKCDGKDTEIQFSYAIAQNVDKFVLKDVVLDASRFAAADSVKMSRVRIDIEPASVLSRVPYTEITLGAGLLALGVAGGFYWGRKGKKRA